MFDRERAFLEERLAALGAPFDLSPFWEKLVALAEALEARARELNLTAVRGVSARLTGPFLECLLLAQHLPPLSPAVDLGAGAGLPGLVVKIVRPEIELYLLEAHAPRVAFMQEFVRDHALPGAHPRRCHLGREAPNLRAPLALARGYGEVGKFVRHAAGLVGARRACYLWRRGVEPWREGDLPMRLLARHPIPEREVELLLWERIP